MSQSPFNLLRDNTANYLTHKSHHKHTNCYYFCRYSLSVRGMQVLWLASGVCRYSDQYQWSAGTLINVRGIQVLWSVSGVCRCSDQCQGYAGTLISVRGLQVLWSVSGVCRYSDQCQGHAGTLISVRGMQVLWSVSGVYRNWPTVTPSFHGCTIRGLTHPIDKVTLQVDV